ncbi:hypothetical protein FMEXI_12489 [Fusarium mexicanum]|uniref:Uncharacterized protein n=1 Tax=Fusarium mexicanum TaxID=751941 RepID=A0A8H5IA44_9HYPO|nr:hypothetical protein FMEXI_12489 [Fusarium mexicanum]
MNRDFDRKGPGSSAFPESHGVVCVPTSRPGYSGVIGSSLWSIPIEILPLLASSSPCPSSDTSFYKKCLRKILILKSLFWNLETSKPPEDACMLNRFIYDVSSLQERLLQSPGVKNPGVVPATGLSEKMEVADPPEDKGKL